MEKEILKIIKEIIRLNVLNKIHPTHAISSNVFKKLQEIEPGITTESYQILINRMVTDNKIKFGRTINDIWFTI